MPGHLCVIINPTAGRGRGHRAWQAIRLKILRAGWVLREVIVSRPGQAWPLAEQAAREGYDLVAAVGGDGTIHEVVNGLMHGPPDHRPTLAVIPGGTANIFTRALGLPKEPRDAAHLLLTGTTRRIDLGQVNGRFYASVAGAGFDGEVTTQANRWRRRWTWTKPLFVAAILKTLAWYRPVESSILLDGAEIRTRAFLVTAANTAWYGGGIYIAPHARIDSGTLAAVIAHDMNGVEAFWILLRTFSGLHLRHPKIIHATAREIRVDSHRPLAVHADGESLGHTPVTFRIVPGALTVIVPKEANAVIGPTR